MSPRPEFVGGDGERFSPRIPIPPVPARVQGILFAVITLGILLMIPYFMFLEYVRPNEFGIKEIQVGLDRGIQEKVYPPGLAFVMPFGWQKIHRLPRNLQVLEMTEVAGNRHTASRGGTVYIDEPAKIQPSDGFFVDVDATILYRIVDPYDVVTTLGPGGNYLHQGILPKAEPILKEALGKLNTEDFYNSPLRVERANVAVELLNEELNPKGLQVDHVLVRYFTYAPTIQQNIEARKLQDQLVFTNQSLRKAAEAQQALNRVTEQGEARVKMTLEEGNAYQVTKGGEKEFYTRQRQAEADLLVELAEAKRAELRNEAMQLAGASKNVAMEMARVLSGLDAIIVPVGGDGGMNPLDLEEIVATFGVNDEVGTTAVAAQPASTQRRETPRAPRPVTGQNTQENE